MVKSLDDVLGEGNPLSVFDFITKQVANGNATPEIKEVVSRVRGEVEAEQRKLEQYRMLRGYMTILKDKLSANEDYVKILQEAVEKMTDMRLFSE